MSISYIPESLEDIAKTFEVMSKEAGARPTESNRAAQAYRNGRVQGINECAMMTRMMHFKPRTKMLEAIAQLRNDHRQIQAQFLSMNLYVRDSTGIYREVTPAIVADWLELYTDQFHSGSRLNGGQNPITRPQIP